MAADSQHGHRPAGQHPDRGWHLYPGGQPPAQSYLVEQALPSSIEATRNDIERILVQPLTAAKDIASNSMVRDWLASGEDSSKTAAFAQYLEGIRAEHKAFTALIIGSDSNHYITEKAWIARSAGPNQPMPGSIPSSTATSRAP